MAETTFRATSITAHTLDIIMAGLLKVEVGGGSVDRDTWSRQFDSLSPPRRLDICEVKDVCVALDSLLQVARIGVSILEGNGGADQRHTIHSLPDETLANIFEFNHDDVGKSNEYSIDISHTCRRFRMVALHCPRLWSVVHNGQNADELDPFLSRSGRTKLTVAVNEDLLHELYSSNTIPVKKFMDVVTKQLDRWGSFRCIVNDEVGSETIEVLCEYTRLHLPMLTTFTCKNRMKEYPEPLDIFYKSWLMPSLIRYSAVRTFPPHGMSGTLKTVDLSLSRLGHLGVEQLRYTLHYATELESLAIKFRDSAPTLIVDFHGPVIDNLCLPKLRCFSLDFNGMEFHFSECVRDVFRNFTAPVATILALKGGYGSLDEILLAIIPNDQVFPSVNRFELLPRGSRVFGQETLPIALARMPSLQHLSIRSESYGCKIRRLFDKRQTFPQLLSLRLEHCGDVSDAAIRAILSELQRGVSWPEFQNLKLHQCARLSKIYLERLKHRMGNKLEYSLAFRSRSPSSDG
ncbi:hypothetical protein BD410DRAFT_790093 [Rickenella mellea]|uniref:Uncharacterized protein n=1 Tax=Rickenella mellea TaxID=50990 RepID=A0A4Y7Q2K2_9AGAM|nr:hypothetical protein BD410DRAFT_790093 [Rickenella mellea]